MSTSNQQVDNSTKHLQRALIIDSSIYKYQETMDSLRLDDWDIRSTHDKGAIVGIIANFKPSVVIINLFMSNTSTLKIVQEIKNMSIAVGTKIIVVTSHYSEENIRQAVRYGANDFIIEPFDSDLLLERIKFQLQEKSNINLDDESIPQKSDLHGEFKLMYECFRILAEFTNNQSAIFEILKRIGDFSEANRVNIMLADLKNPNALVVSSSDDAAFKDINVDLDRYSEVREVLLKNQILHIKDITSNPLTSNIRDNVKTIDIQGLLVVPIRHRGATIGTMALKFGKQGISINQDNLKVFFMLAMALAPKIAAKKLILDRAKTAV